MITNCELQFMLRNCVPFPLLFPLPFASSSCCCWVCVDDVIYVCCLLSFFLSSLATEYEYIFVVHLESIEAGEKRNGKKGEGGRKDEAMKRMTSASFRSPSIDFPPLEYRNFEIRQIC